MVQVAKSSNKDVIQIKGLFDSLHRIAEGLDKNNIWEVVEDPSFVLADELRSDFRNYLAIIASSDGYINELEVSCMNRLSGALYTTEKWLDIAARARYELENPYVSVKMDASR